MEIKLKKSFSLSKWVNVFLTIALVVVGIVYKVVPCYILAALNGLMSLVEIIKEPKYSLVIDENGIRIGSDYRHLWNQVDHCYFTIRKTGFGRFTQNLYGLVVVAEEDKSTSFINLRNYSYDPVKLTGEVNDLLGKEMIRMELQDMESEKAQQKSWVRSGLVALMIIIVLLGVFALITCL